MNTTGIPIPDKPVPIQLPNPPVQFATALAHEVRNPLTNINLSVEMLSSAINDDELRLYLDIIIRSTTRINDLVKELLAYQRTTEIQIEEHSIHELLNEVIDMTKDRIILKHVSVKKEFDPEDHIIILNRPRMQIALTNIIINAIDSMIPGIGELTLATKQTEDAFVVTIGDNGCGISEGNLRYIFRPYFTSKPDGLGLGLATTFDILLTNQVGVKIESEVGEGTRFILSFKNGNSIFPTTK